MMVRQVNILMSLQADVFFLHCCLWKMYSVTAFRHYLVTKATVILMWSQGAANTRSHFSCHF